MPTLPSGRVIGLSRSHAIDHGRDWFCAPPGHFWVWMPDTPPPFPKDAAILSSPRAVPVPTSDAETRSLLHIIEIFEGKYWTWFGDYADADPVWLDLSTADLHHCRSWLRSPAVARFVADSRAYFATLAVRAAHVSGWAMVTPLRTN
jgi:hypothetical protein